MEIPIWLRRLNFPNPSSNICGPLSVFGALATHRYVSVTPLGKRSFKYWVPVNRSVIFVVISLHFPVTAKEGDESDADGRPHFASWSFFIPFFYFLFVSGFLKNVRNARGRLDPPKRDGTTAMREFIFIFPPCPLFGAMFCRTGLQLQRIDNPLVDSVNAWELLAYQV